MPDTTQRRYCRKAVVLKLLCWMFMAFVATIAVLRFGNPQWGESIYLFQAYIYPKYRFGYIPPSDDYEGVWIAYLIESPELTYKRVSIISMENGKRKERYWAYRSDNGRLAWFDEELNRKYAGYSYSYNKDGVLRFLFKYSPDGKRLIRKAWHDNGILMFDYPYVNGVIDGAVMRYDRNGRLIRMDHYKNGKFISREEINVGQNKEPLSP